ncbi:sugar ABC transporter substrate-binding protein [Poseidonocella sp. HB161398]|uniref:sugar ABC transporter substrate-binding protein n=1 Tax=Poseidonocella sp. HB161398 TaxID=2320855 RepID=UPI001109B435|nr:sugar ABC transporter substrate-binding protein [Poseidonocella sp. HB161398]
MKTFLITTAIASALAVSASAENIGVSMSRFDDNWLTVLRNAISARADASDDISVQIEDARDDVARQLDQVKNFIATGVDAIVVNAVDTSATQALTDEAEAAGIPLVFVNRMPVNLDSLPDSQAFVGSDERDSGTLETIAVCDQLAAAGKTEADIYIMMGMLSNQAAVQRTQDIHDVVEAGKCAVTLNVIDKQTAEWQRDLAQDLMTNWLSSGTPFDAVISNNDEMAIGAIQAIKAAGISMEDVVIGGVDATQDALLAMAAGELDVTVFQNAAGQGEGALDAALALARGEEVDRTVWVPFELVTPANMRDYVAAN